MKIELPDTPNRTPYYVLALLVLIAWGFLLRIYALGDQSLWPDEAASITIGQGIWDHGRPIVPSGLEMWRGLVNNGLIGLLLKIFGESEFIVRLPSVVFGTAIIPVVFLFAKKTTKSNKAALFAAFLTTILLVQVAWSRQARMYQEFQFFTILSLYFFYLFTETHRKRDFILGSVFLGLATLDQYFGLLILLALVAFALLENRRDIRRVFTREWLLRWQVVAAALCIAILAAFAITQLHLGTLIWNMGGIYLWLLEYIIYFVACLFVISLLAIAGAVALRRRNRRAALFLVLAIVVPIFFLSLFLKESWGTRYVYNLLPVLFVLCSFALVRVWESPPRLMGKRLPGVLLVVVIIATMLLTMLLPQMLTTTLPSGFVFTPQRFYFNFDWGIQQPDFKAAYNYVNDNRQADDIVIDGWPTLGTWYLDNPPNYTLYFSGKHDQLGRDRYMSTPGIWNLDTLESIFLQNKGGWLIVDTFVWERLPSDVQDFFSQNLTKEDIGPREEGPHGRIHVYKWPKEA